MLDGTQYPDAREIDRPEVGAVAALEMACDGAIPPLALARARAVDAERARLSARPSCRVRIKEWKPAGIIDRLATRMLEHVRMSSTGTVLTRQLVEDGFSPDELATYADRAKALAARRLEALNQALDTIGSAA